jgi:DNA-binding transcriptional MerR regulator
MEASLTITEVARRTGLSVHTLRYYEQAGLIRPIARTASGRRRYAETDLDWIAFLLRLRETRMPIAQMQLFARLRSQGDSSAPARRVMLEQHLAELLATITALQDSAHALQDKIAHYRAIEASLPATTQPSGRKRHEPDPSTDSGSLPARPGKTQGNRR